MFIESFLHGRCVCVCVYVCVWMWLQCFLLLSFFHIYRSHSHGLAQRELFSHFSLISNLCESMYAHTGKSPRNIEPAKVMFVATVYSGICIFKTFLFIASSSLSHHFLLSPHLKVSVCIDDLAAIFNVALKCGIAIARTLSMYEWD